jgi:putative transcriptional regulator
MSKAGKKILGAAREMLAIARGEDTGAVVHVPEMVDVKAVRRKIGMTQRQFASAFGFGYDAVRDWELRRRRPERTARVLLVVIDHEPEAVTRALAARAGKRKQVEQSRRLARGAAARLRADLRALS